MKQASIFILCILCFLTGNSQKRVVFANDDLQEISEKDYNASLKDGDYRVSYDLDTLTLKVRVRRASEGQLSSESYKLIKESLEKSSGVKIESGNTIVVDYFPGIDRCNNASVPKDPHILYFKEKYAKNVSEFKNVNQFFVYKEKEGTQSYGKKIKWIADEGHLVENTFFKLPYPCGSYVIIDSSGNYYSYKGEYNSDDIVKRLKKH